MIDANDRLPTNKPEPLKTTEWILLGILIIMLLFTFPFLWWIYRPLLWVIFRFALPIGALIFIGYFALRYTQLGETPGTSDDFLQKFSKVWTDFVSTIRKSFKTIALTTIIVMSVSVVSIIGYTKYSRKNVTEKQLFRMSQALAKHKNELGNYPTDLAGLIGNDPLKREWFQDSWGNSIDYTITKNGAGYVLLSSGADGAKGTSDDITVSR